MACGPNRAPGRCEVPPSNGAPMIMMSVPAQDGGSARSARFTPRKVASGPYIPPRRVIRSTYAGPDVAAVLGRRLEPAGRTGRPAGQDAWQRPRQPPVRLPEQLPDGRGPHPPDPRAV